MPTPKHDHVKTLSRIAKKTRRRARQFWQRAQGKPCLHFLHLGKTGGSAIKYAIEQRSDSQKGYAIYLHAHMTRLRNVPLQEQFFFFVRDPITRFISGFYSRQRQGQPNYFLRWTPGEEAAFARFKTPNQLAAALSSTDSDERERAEAAMRSILHVKDSYWYWFESREYLTSRLDDLFFIGFQEQLSDDFEALAVKLSLPGLILPQDDINAHRNPTELDRHLDEDAVANLERWYAADFKFLELCTEIKRKQQIAGAANVQNPAT